jgi:hypothetical protein
MKRTGPIYAIRLQARPGTDGIRTLRAALKILWRRHQLRCLDAREVTDNASTPQLHPVVQASELTNPGKANLTDFVAV